MTLLFPNIINGAEVTQKIRIGLPSLAVTYMRQLSRGVTCDEATKPEGMQLMIDLVREDSKVSQPFTVTQIVDYSFFEKARVDLGVAR